MYLILVRGVVGDGKLLNYATLLFKEGNVFSFRCFFISNTLIQGVAFMPSMWHSNTRINNRGLAYIQTIATSKLKYSLKAYWYSPFWRIHTYLRNEINLTNYIHIFFLIIWMVLKKTRIPENLIPVNYIFFVSTIPIDFHLQWINLLSQFWE